MQRKNPGIKDYLRWLCNKKSGRPRYSGEYLTGVEVPVKIYYDPYGIPNIYAGNETDLFFAQGFVHANDRLFQMDLLRRYASGRTAEVVGKRMLDADILHRSIGLRRAAEFNLKFYGGHAMDVLNAYAAGVNAYIETALRGSNLPPEFLLLGYEPEPWTSVDSVCLSKLIALRTGGNMDTELLFFAAAGELGADSARLRELLPVYPEYGPSFMGAAMNRNDTRGIARLINARKSGGDAKYPGGASNNWVVSGAFTESGYPILASDMHLPLDLPNIFMVSHLVVPGTYKVNGVMFPGIPGVISGFNEYIAWSETTLPADTMDLYRIKFSAENPKLYRYDDNWREADIINELIQVRGAEDINLEIPVTHHGPVISGAVGMDTPLALRWVETAPDIMEQNLGIEAMLGIIRSTSFEEFRQHLQKFTSPPHNFIYADVNGNIGLLANGLFPIRSSAHRAAGNGLFPVPGWDSAYEWNGFVPWDDIPSIYNPPAGIIVSANHKVVEDDYPYFITDEWHHPARAVTILKELKSCGKLDSGDMKRIQNSLYNSQAAILVPVISEILAKFRGELNPVEEEALHVLCAWGQTPEDAPDAAGPAVFYHLYDMLMHRLYLEKVSPELREMLSGYRNLYITTENILLAGESAWTDDPDRDLFAAFRAAVQNLSRFMGREPSRWKWGFIHRFTMKHHLGDDVSKRTYNRGPFFVGGSSSTPCMQEFHLDSNLPYRVYMGAPHRLVLDLSNHNAWEVMTAGNSGHAASPHYDDMVKMWLRGEYKPVMFDDAVIKNLKNVVTLLPSRG